MLIFVSMTNVSNEHIDPYSLLGVTYESSITEVRKAFFELALLCHPDKGGNPDDMRMLQCAYDWITRNLHVVNQTISEHDWIDFLNTSNQEESKCTKVPSITDIELRVLGLHDDFFESLFADHKDYIEENSRVHKVEVDFVKGSLKQTVSMMIHMYAIQLAEHTKPQQVAKSWYQKHLQTFFENCNNVAHASVLSGYEAMMDMHPEDRDETCKPLLCDFGKKELIVHKEPSEAPVKKSEPVVASASLVLPTNMEDFTTTSLCDYRQAFMDESNAFDELLEQAKESEQTSITAALETLKTMRALEDAKVSLHPVQVHLSFKNQKR